MKSTAFENAMYCKLAKTPKKRKINKTKLCKNLIYTKSDFQASKTC